MRAFYADLTESAEAVRAIKARIDPRGMTRPPRHPDERAWLAARGRLGPFAERDGPYVDRPPRDDRSTPGDTGPGRDGPGSDERHGRRGG